ncbi:MAG TPA: hypothetical protein VII95_12885 [Terriglobales bacterium]|jgi:hypothetical protein
MDPHYFNQKGANAEKVIHDLANKTFFTDWCYPNPKKADGNELCDLLVVFDDTALIWQIKDLKIDDAGRYKKAEVEKNLCQLGGARRTLFELKTPIILSNPRRGPEQFDPASIRHVHLVSVLMGDGEEPFPFVQEVKNHLLHVFTRDFADIMLSELDTVSDFCHYLRAKESIDKTKSIVVFGGEENLLGKYLEHGRSFSWMEDYNLIHIDDTIWPAISSKPQYIKKKQLDKVSYGWDSIIERAHEGSPMYELVARELARPDRFTRRMLSQSFLEVYSEFRQMTDKDMMRRHFSLGDTTYCFLITENEEEYPKERRGWMLEAMCLVARGLNPENYRVVGVATDRGNKNYHFAYFYIPEWTPEMEAEKVKLQTDAGIFVAPRVTRFSDDEYPPLEET